MNTFAPFKAHPDALTLAGIAGFTQPPKFEGKCPNGLFEANGEPSRSPNLDVLAFAGDTVVAVESKFLEPLSKKKQELSPKYLAPFLGKDGTRPSPNPNGPRCTSAWRAWRRIPRKTCRTRTSTPRSW